MLHPIVFAAVNKVLVSGSPYRSVSRSLARDCGTCIRSANSRCVLMPAAFLSRLTVRPMDTGPAYPPAECRAST